MTQEQRLLEYTASKNGDWVSKREYQLTLQLSQSGRAINTILHKRKDFYDKWLASRGWVFEQRMNEDGKPYQDEFKWTYFRIRPAHPGQLFSVGDKFIERFFNRWEWLFKERSGTILHLVAHRLCQFPRSGPLECGVRARQKGRPESTSRSDTACKNGHLHGDSAACGGDRR